MIAIALRRGISQVVASPRVAGGEQGKTDRGWQGKRPAVGPAYVVGRAGGFGDGSNGHCWRSAQFLKGNQSCERHRPKAQGGFAP
jgi:hypothetical protein